jgi:hypothetical protein
MDRILKRRPARVDLIEQAYLIAQEVLRVLHSARDLNRILDEDD